MPKKTIKQEDALPAFYHPQALRQHRVLFMSLCAIIIGALGVLIAQTLLALIGFFTNLAFYGRLSFSFSSPAENQLGPWVIAIPVLGGLVIGPMARWFCKAIRGDGIPEAMEQILTNESRVSPRLTFFKPLSFAIAMGTGCPFGAEGPIIATGGALGSLMGQLLKTSAHERKILLAAGAAAGMAAIFGSPVSAVILAVELLLFEFRPSSLIPVALASATAMALRTAWVGFKPTFVMPELAYSTVQAYPFYILIGTIVGLASVGVTKAVYAIEDWFEHLPLHWMWWPAIGGLAVGLIGYVSPHTLGVGYDNIEHILSASVGGKALLFFCLLKFLSWAICLGSGTSGGTLAPLFTVGGGLGAVLALCLPGFGLDPKMGALVGMAAIFAGASRALLASVIFAFEATLQPAGLLPLLGGCTAAYCVSYLLMRTTIMTEKVVRRGVKVPEDYMADYLGHVPVKQAGLKPVTVLRASQSVKQVRQWLNSGAPGSFHQGYPVVDDRQHLIGVLTQREIYNPKHSETRKLRQIIQRPPAVIFEDCSLREAADHMLHAGVGRLPVVRREDPRRIVGMLTRSDILKAHAKRLSEHHNYNQTLSLPLLSPAAK